MLKALSDRPNVVHLERSLDRLLQERGQALEFVILFGSMAKGNWSMGSDYDLFVGLCGPDGKRLTDRIGEFEALVEGNIQVFPYERPAWERMFRTYHTLMLEVLEHGIVLFDRGGAMAMRRRFLEWRADGVVTPLPSGWSIKPPTG